MATTMVARSRGTFSIPNGRHQATMAAAKASSDMATEKCRFHCGWPRMTAATIPALGVRTGELADLRNATR